MNILLLEAGGSHIECIYSLVHILHKKDCRVFIACNKKLVPLLIETSKIEGILELPDTILKRQHLLQSLRIRKFIQRQRITHTVINTTEISFVRDMLFVLPHLNYAGIVHNAKRLEKSFTYTKLLSRKVKKFLVLGDYLRSLLQPHPVFNVSSFYPVYFPKVSELLVKKPAHEIWITVPGEASQERRDYAGLLTAIENSNIDLRVKFIFLGLNKLNSFLNEQLQHSEKLHHHIISFHSYLSYEQFHSYMLQSDYVLPLLKNTGDDFFGNSRISGSFNLGLGYHLPFLLPASYQVNTDLLPYSIYYSDAHDLLQQLFQQETVQLQAQKINEAYTSGRFNDIDNVLQDVYNFIVS